MSRGGRDTGRDETPPSSTIMMVDDEPTTLDVMEMFLQAEGYRNLVKHTEAKQVVAQVATVRPDVLLLNLMMPDVTGLDVLGAMQADPSLREVPVIIITSSTDPKLKRKAYELGAADFLAEPVDPSELTLRVRNILAAQSARSGVAPEPPPAARAVRPRLAGEPERVRAIVEQFVEHLERNLAAMEASFAARSLEELAGLAHWLKGSAGTVGLHEFTQPAESLRILAREGKEEEIATAIEALRDLAERIEVPDALDG